MRVIDTLTEKAGRVAGDLQDSLRRARAEGEKRLLQRQHRAALEQLGLRVYELVRAGELPEQPIGVEIAAVESKLIEIEAKVDELDNLRPGDPAEEPVEAPAEDDARPPSGATSAPVDPALAAFPMIDTPAGDGAERRDGDEP